MRARQRFRAGGGSLLAASTLGLALLAATVAAGGCHRQALVPVDQLSVVSRGDPGLFTLYCGLNAAGYDEEWGEAMHPVRTAVRTALATADPAEFDAFRAVQAKASSWQLQNVVLVELGPPPDFAPGQGSGPLAPELSKALGSLWRSRAEALWQEYGSVHEEYAASLAGPARETIEATLAYCGENYSSTASVVVIPNLATSAKTASLQFDEASGTAYVVVGPGDGLPLNAVAHEFSHRIVGEVVSRQAERGALDRFRPVLDVAVERKTVAAQSYPDLYAYVGDCLMRAMTIRIRPDDKIEERLDRETGWGFYLVRPMWAALERYEASDEKLTDYLPGLLRELDVEGLVEELTSEPAGGP